MVEGEKSPLIKTMVIELYKGRYNIGIINVGVSLYIKENFLNFIIVLCTKRRRRKNLDYYILSLKNLKYQLF